MGNGQVRSLLIFGLILVLLPKMADVARADDFAWPQVLRGQKGEIRIYQPQMESFSGNRLEARSAVSLHLKGQDDPVFGAVWFACDLATDQEARSATLERVQMTAAKFPDMDEQQVAKLSSYLEQEIPKWDLVMSLDRLAASLDGAVGNVDRDDNLRDDPPVIHFRTVPAVLVLVDGEPILADLVDSELQYVANSMFFIVKDRQAGAYFLRGAGLWFTSDDLGGKWVVTTRLSAAVAKVSQKIEDEEKEQAAAAQADAQQLEVVRNPDEPAPEIILSMVPAELIVTDGEPDFASVAGTQLLYLKNTESDVVMDIASQDYFILVSGRWYRSKSLPDGPWRYVDFDDLPAEFAAIPPDSDLGTVLASVAGTQEAREAVLETQIPQTAEVDRKTAKCEVSYDGDPQFESCGTGVSYAINTDKSVLLIDKKYYCVDSAVWFVANGPEGPWQVATEVPAVVQDLPADCPVYNVKYVYIYESTPEIVYVGYTSGYYGYYVHGPCVVYGTGWYYRPWWGHYYYPRPVTYGFGVHYNPWSGWGFTYGMSYGWLHIGVSWGRPYYGCWGAGGYRYGYRHGYWRGYNHGYRHGYRRGAAAGYRAGYRAGQRQPRANVYRDRKSGVRRTGDLGKQARQRPATSDKRNNVYTDRKGDVYRNNDGKWEKREEGNWRPDGEQGAAKPEDRKQRDREKERDLAKPSDRQEKDRSREQAKPSDRSRDQAKPSDRQENDRSRDQAKPNDRQQRDRQQLDRDRSSRQRGNDRDRQAQPRQAPQRKAPRQTPSRPSGGGRRR